MRKKKNRDENQTDDTLLQMMTISLFIILLAFFILLNAIAVVDEKKQRKVVDSIVESFGGHDLFESTTGNYSENVFADGVSPLDFQALIAGTSKKLKDIKIDGNRKRTVLSIPEGLIFSRYGVKVKRGGQIFLAKLAKIILANKFPVGITCHLDDIPIIDKAGMSARELTAIRSVRVLRFMVDQGKVPASRLTTCGWGGEKPRVSNKTIKSRNMNRRIDITFVHDQSKSGKKGFFIFKDFFFNVDK